MTVTLFRQEAIDHQRLRIWGEVTLALPMSYALLTGFIAASVLAAALFIGTQSYARKEHATGFLVPSAGVARIAPPRPGTVIDVAVREGQHVERGALLMTVSDAETSERGENVDTAKALELQAQRDRLRDQIGLEREKSQLEARQLQSQIVTARQEIIEFRHQETIQADRIEIARQQLSGALELAAKGYLSRVELRSRQDAHLAEQQSESALAKERLAKEAELSGLQEKLQQLPIATAESAARTEAEIAEIETRLKDVDRERGYQLRAGYRRCRLGSAKAPTHGFRSSRSFPKATSSRPNCSSRRGRSGLSPVVKPSKSATTRFRSSSSALPAALFGRSRAHC
jgi:membrane fusion protein